MGAPCSKPCYLSNSQGVHSTGAGKSNLVRPHRRSEYRAERGRSQLHDPRPQWYPFRYSAGCSPHRWAVCGLRELATGTTDLYVPTRNIPQMLTLKTISVFTMILWACTLGFTGLKDPSTWQAANALFILGNLGGSEPISAKLI